MSHPVGEVVQQLPVHFGVLHAQVHCAGGAQVQPHIVQRAVRQRLQIRLRGRGRPLVRKTAVPLARAAARAALGSCAALLRFVG